jgi:hypothetical protein
MKKINYTLLQCCEISIEGCMGVFSAAITNTYTLFQKLIFCHLKYELKFSNNLSENFDPLFIIIHISKWADVNSG